MKVIEQYAEAAEYAPLCIALGSFDGVHAGHRRLIELLLEEAGEYGTKSMVYTFSSHPRKTLASGKPIYLLTDNEKKIEIMGELGVEILFFEDFKKIMSMSAEEFVSELLVKRFGVQCVIVGYNYRFGRKGEGNTEKLLEYGEKYGFKVVIVPAVEINGHTVSSSMIRHIIRSGAVDGVPRYLGRPYSIKGRVIYGKQNGEVMGIRTANIEITKEITLPQKGVYHTITAVNGASYKSVTNIGMNPTFNGESLSVETHIIGFSGYIYDEKIEVLFLKRIRDEMKFESMDMLAEQINQDIRQRIELAL